ncbi:fold protein [Gossypium australe]|uniref:Fold protein n=1 Tax=Gossypium australe TaxID=47621 RepID=A0A5B6VL54_9ROSI|nr:fold protein [Gossypium australe]
MGKNMSRLSIENFDVDVDEEFFVKESCQLLSDSDKEPYCYSLPAVPPHRVLSKGAAKDCGSENEAQKGSLGWQKGSKNVRRRSGSCWDKEIKSSSEKKEEGLMVGYNGNSFSGESEGEVVVITRPKGGKRSLCMDMEEVKACRDLGFELEKPSRFSSFDATSSDGTSPITNWRISGPGDDPRDVKARLKVCAQAVELASTSMHCG